MKFRIADNSLDIEFNRFETLAGLKHRLILPFDKILSVKLADDSALPNAFAKLIGYNGPIYRAGLFRKDSETVFVNAHKDNDLLVIETKDYVYPRLILDHREMNQEITNFLLKLKN